MKLIVKNTATLTITLCLILILLATYERNIGCRNKLDRSCAFISRYSDENVV